MSPEILELIKSVGIPWTIVIVIGWIIYRIVKNHVWPFITKIVTEMVEYWKNQVKEMNEARNESFSQLANFIKTEADKTEKMVAGFEELTNFIQGEGRKNEKILSSLTMLNNEILDMRADTRNQKRREENKQNESN